MTLYWYAVTATPSVRDSCTMRSISWSVKRDFIVAPCIDIASDVYPIDMSVICIFECLAARWVGYFLALIPFRFRKTPSQTIKPASNPHSPRWLRLTGSGLRLQPRAFFLLGTSMGPVLPPDDTGTGCRVTTLVAVPSGVTVLLSAAVKVKVTGVFTVTGGTVNEAVAVAEPVPRPVGGGVISVIRIGGNRVDEVQVQLVIKDWVAVHVPERFTVLPTVAV